MLFESEFRRPTDCGALLDTIRKLSAQLPPVRIMEVCGTHTMAIAKSGLRQILPANIELVSGPGCPVCVTPTASIDEALRLSSLPNVILTTYGDLMRVPGSVRGDNLNRRKALGADIRVVYSPMDALSIALAEPNRQVIFLGVGFETTAPGTALAVLEAQNQNLQNFSLYSMLKRTPPALHALVAQDDFGIDAFLCPGHVATVLGANAFRFLAEEYGFPCVVAGFENGDLLAAIALLLQQMKTNSPKLENEYIRAVSSEGNCTAVSVMEKVFTPCTCLWRGLGAIPDSGFCLQEEYSSFDAAKRFGTCSPQQDVPTPCRCGDVICGRIGPAQCSLFGTVCTPNDPVGPCMVSGEGACAAAYHYGRSL